MIRSKELEVLLSRARAAEQKQLAEGEKVRAERVEEEARPHQRFVIRFPYVNPPNAPTYLPTLPSNGVFSFFLQNQQIRKELDDAQKGQTMLVERLISCCKEVRLLPFFQDSPLLQRTHARARTHPFSPVSFNVLSDRDRTFTAQRRAHAAPIRIPSRRAGEEGWQDPEGGKYRRGEWDKLTLNRRRRQIQIPMYPTRIHTHTLFLFFPHLFTVIFLVLLVDQSILEEGNHTGFSRTLSRKSKKHA